MNVRYGVPTGRDPNALQKGVSAPAARTHPAASDVLRYGQGMSLLSLVTLACLIVSGVTPAIGREEAGCGARISQRARSLQPGEVLMLTVESPEPQSQVEAVAFGKTFPFFADGKGRTWKGLVGIDLEAAAGGYTIKLQLTDKSGKARVCGHPIRIRPKTFPTRKLTVDEKFVTPPKEVLSRIEEEGKRVSAIFATTDAQRYWQGAFAAPVPGPSISSFGKRNILNGKPRSPHSGADFEAAEGEPISAPNAGKVVLAEDLYYSGNTVIIDHGQGLYSYLAHLSRFSVKEGDHVARRDVVGRVGATGRVTGPHLHWSVRLVGTRVDPLSLIAVSGSTRTAKPGQSKADRQ
jgi:murein DD-endopeptidase MepM/ murein hydrolase activator NlpD